MERWSDNQNVKKNINETTSIITDMFNTYSIVSYIKGLSVTQE